MWVGNTVEKGEGTGIPKLVKVGGVGTGNNGTGGGKFTTPSLPPPPPPILLLLIL